MVMPFVHRGVEHKEGHPLLEVIGVTVRYNGRVALEDVSFTLGKGEHVAVVGPNGAGKSTLFKVIAGVLKPHSGQVRVFGSEPGGHICIAYVPQRTQVDWSFPATVADVVMMGRVGKMGPLRWPSKSDWQFVYRCLEMVGLRDLAHRQIGELSGGQQQRMFIARALAQEAELILMDEPLTGLDATSQGEVLNALERLRHQGVTVMLATHNLNLAADRFDRIMLLNRRILGIGKPSEVFTPENLAQAYGDHLRVVRSENGVMLLSDTCCQGDLEG